MVHYGDETANLYSGTFSMSIPVYTYQDEDFTIPISLDYAYNGYRPNISTGTTGLGWNLNVGGAITREVRGIMDDASSTWDLYNYYNKWEGISHFHPYYTLTIDVFGYAYYCQLSDDALASTRADIVYSGKAGEEYMPVMASTSSSNAYEVQPDIFHFSAPGESGSFILRPSGGYVFFDTSGPSRLYELSYVLKGQGFTSFHITSPNKTEYRFDYIEYAVSESTCGSDSGLQTPGSWRLTSIIAPNGRYVDFEYGVESLSQTYYPAYTNDTNRKVAFYNEESNIHSPEENTFEAMFHSVTTVTCGCITNISTGDGRVNIDFSYGSKASEEGASSGMKKLEHIVVSNPDEENVRVCNLNYWVCSEDSGDSYDTIANGVTFLDNIWMEGTGTYSFSYYRSAALPRIDTYNIDWYGYYAPYSNDFVPSLSSARAGDGYLLNMRQADSTACMYGVMTSVQYPTGGRSEMEYEANRYGYDYTLKDRNATNSITSGVRISKILTYESDGNHITSRRFVYEDDNSHSYGRLVWRPIIYCKYTGTSSTLTDILRETLSTSSDFPFSGNVHVEYPRVREIISSSEGSSESTIIDYEYLGARYSYGSGHLSGSSSTYSAEYSQYPGFDYQFSVPTRTSQALDRLSMGEQSTFRGKLLSRTVRDGHTNRLIQKDSILYGSCDAGTLYDVVCHLGYRLQHSLGLQYPYVNERVVKKYGDDGFLMSESVMGTSVDDQFRTSSVTGLDSSGNVVKTAYTYHPVAKTYVSEVKTLRNGYVTGLTKYDYMHLGGNHYAPLSMRTATIDALRTDLSGISSYVTEFTVDSHDSYGRPLQITEKGGKVTDIVWDGSNPASVSNPVGSNVLMTSYGWKPLVGMTSHVLPSGRSTFYEYDDAGRLVLIRDGSGLPVSFYKYNVVRDFNQY